MVEKPDFLLAVQNSYSNCGVRKLIFVPTILTNYQRQKDWMKPEAQFRVADLTRAVTLFFTYRQQIDDRMMPTLRNGFVKVDAGLYLKEVSRLEEDTAEEIYRKSQDFPFQDCCFGYPKAVFPLLAKKGNDHEIHLGGYRTMTPALEAILGRIITLKQKPYQLIWCSINNYQKAIIPELKRVGFVPMHTGWIFNRNSANNIKLFYQLT